MKEYCVWRVAFITAGIAIVVYKTYKHLTSQDEEFQESFAFDSIFSKSLCHKSIQLLQANPLNQLALQMKIVQIQDR